MRFCGGLTAISLGSNVLGSWGPPQEALRRALEEISRLGIRPVARSMLYRTAPYGGVRQNAFHNAAALVETPLSAEVLLRLFKEIEARAGRVYYAAGRVRWGPRPLDIDIVDYKGLIRNWKMRKPLLGHRLILPHAEAHKRAFVLRPLADIAPTWHHPVFGLTAGELLKRPEVARAGAVLERLETPL